MIQNLIQQEIVRLILIKINKNFINKIIENGKKELKDSKELEKYINLANEFWELKKQFINYK